LPGSIGNVGYYLADQTPFKGDADAFNLHDSGILFADWDRWQVAYDKFTNDLHKTGGYNELKVAYNAKALAEK